jgi:acetyl-CoA/propionyl-CoA carboxylase, biotin carboxylase, biotin carboxyl carrier protein
VLLLDELPTGTAGTGTAGPGTVRVDSSLVEGLELSANYDPMMSKVIAWGGDRAAALDTLDATLAGYTALGLDTNVEYLRLLINDADVRAGRLDTGLIERKMPGFAFRRPGDAELMAAALPFWVLAEGPAAVGPPWDSTRGWRLGAPAPWTMSFGTPGGGLSTVAVTFVEDIDLGRARVRVDDGPEHDVTVIGLASDNIFLEVDGVEYRFAHAKSGQDFPREDPPEYVQLGNQGWSCRLEPLTRETRLARVLAAVEREEGAADPAVRSPMPGTVVSVSVANGDTVTAGQVLLAVEAMKMEHQLAAPLDGTVHLSAAPGDLVKADQVLATIHPAAAD